MASREEQIARLLDDDQATSRNRQFNHWAQQRPTSSTTALTYTVKGLHDHLTHKLASSPEDINKNGLTAQLQALKALTGTSQFQIEPLPTKKTRYLHGIRTFFIEKGVTKVSPKPSNSPDLMKVRDDVRMLEFVPPGADGSTHRRPSSHFIKQQKIEDVDAASGEPKIKAIYDTYNERIVALADAMADVEDASSLLYRLATQANHSDADLPEATKYAIEKLNVGEEGLKAATKGMCNLLQAKPNLGHLLAQLPESLPQTVGGGQNSNHENIKKIQQLLMNLHNSLCDGPMPQILLSQPCWFGTLKTYHSVGKPMWTDASPYTVHAEGSAINLNITLSTHRGQEKETLQMNDISSHDLLEVSTLLGITAHLTFSKNGNYKFTIPLPNGARDLERLKAALTLRRDQNQNARGSTKVGVDNNLNADVVSDETARAATLAAGPGRG